MRIRIVLLVGAALLVAAAAGADEKADLRAIGEGRALYLTNCAGCHGSDATGLVGHDLKGIARRDGGFDRLRVANHILGRRDGLASQRMPAWRVSFERSWPQGESAVMLNAYKLVRYLQFVQAGVPPEAVASAAPR
jgi:mono/diheme cytochrome c family protein